MTHMKTTLAKMRADGSYKKGDGLKKVIMAAKKTYKKTRRVGRRGGAGEAKPMDKIPVIEEKDEKKEEAAESESDEDVGSQATAATDLATPLSDDEMGGRRRGAKSKSKKKASRRTRRKLRR